MLRILFTLLLICAGCSTVNVHNDYNPAYDFSHLRTYSWLADGKAPSTDSRINNDLVVDRIRNAIETNLNARGFIKTETGNTDFVVSWHGGIQKKLRADTIDHFYSPYGYGPLHQDPRWGISTMRSTTYTEFEVGTLIVDILDPKEHKLIWRGTASDRLLEESNPKEATRKINEAVDAILKDFPPEKKY